MKYVLLIVLVLVVGVVGYRFAYAPSDVSVVPDMMEEADDSGVLTPDTSPNDTAIPRTSTLRQKEDDVADTNSTSSRLTAGTVLVGTWSFMLAKLVMREPGFAVVYETTPEGEQSDVIGVSQYYGLGTYTSIPIELSRATKEGESLLVGIVADSGDRQFSQAEDTAALFSGNPISITVTVGE